MLDQNKENQLNNWLEESVQNNKIPFGEISISKKNKDIYKYKIYTQDEKYKNNNLYRIHSLTKPITSLVSLIVLEKNNINVKEPISTFIPEFKKGKVLIDEELININTPITFEHLLTHTSGLTYGFNRSNQAILRGNTEVDNIYREKGILERIRNSSYTSSDFINDLTSLPLAYQPGTRWNYGLSSDLLGVLLELICKQSLDEICKNELFIPLEMNDTYFPSVNLKNLIPTFKLSLPSGFKLINETDQIKREHKFLSGGGGMISTPQDYIKFCNYILDPKVSLINDNTLSKMKNNQLKHEMEYLTDKLNFYDFTFAGPGTGFSYGFATIENPDIVPQKTPKSVLSWAGAANTIVWIDQINKIVFTFFTQLIPFGYQNYKKELHEILYSDIN